MRKRLIPVSPRLRLRLGQGSHNEALRVAALAKKMAMKDHTIAELQKGWPIEEIRRIRDNLGHITKQDGIPRHSKQKIEDFLKSTDWIDDA